MVCTRKTKTLVSTCVILSGMTNIVCLLYVGWVTNYIASVYVKVQEPISEKKLEEDKGDTLRIIERLDHLENVIKQHIQGTTLLPACFPSPPHPAACPVQPPSPPAAFVLLCVWHSWRGRGVPLLSVKELGAARRLRCVWESPAVPARCLARGAAEAGDARGDLPRSPPSSRGRRRREVASSPRRECCGRRCVAARRGLGAWASRAASSSGEARLGRWAAAEAPAGWARPGAIINLSSAPCLPVCC